MQIIDSKNRIGGLVLLVFSLLYLRHAMVIPLDPTAINGVFTSRTLPIGLAIASIIFALLQLFLPSAEVKDNSISTTVIGFQWRPALLLIFLMVAYAMSFQFLGFIIASIIFLVGGFFVLGERRILHAVGIATTLILILWVLLTKAFGLYLDNGRLFVMVFGES